MTTLAKGQVKKMTKSDFLLKLVQGTSKDEGERLYQYYNEIIEDRIEAGEDEEAIISSFGDVNKIIQEAEATKKVRDFEEKPKLSTGIKALIAVLLVFCSPILLAITLPFGLVAFTLVFTLLIIAFTIVVVFIALGAAGIVGVVAGIVVIVSSPLTGLFILGQSLILIGLGILGFYIASKFAKVVIKGIKQFCGFLIRKFTKKNKEVE